jgi:gliding motility-associated-like protein
MLKAQVAAFSLDTTIGCGKLTFKIKNESTGYSTNTTFTWSFSNAIPPISGENPGTATIDSTGMFVVKLTLDDKNNPPAKTITDTVWIRPNPNAYFHIKDVNNTLAFNFTAAQTDKKGYAYDSIQNSFRYYWSSELLNTIDSISGKSATKDYASIKGDYLLEETIKLRIVDWMGCSDEVSQKFRVFNHLEAPDFVTPNDDGANDYFYIPTNGRTVYLLEVFSRLGVKVYEQKSPTIRWDCTTDNGTPLSPGTYWYVIKTIENSEPGADYNQTGFFMLVKGKN